LEEWTKEINKIKKEEIKKVVNEKLNNDEGLIEKDTINIEIKNSIDKLSLNEIIELKLKLKIVLPKYHSNFKKLLNIKNNLTLKLDSILKDLQVFYDSGYFKFNSRCWGVNFK
jgi:hypothetical protein